MPETEKSYEHTCPECGGDATRIRDRHPTIMRKPKAYRWIAIAVLLCVYVGLIIVMSDWHTSKWKPPPPRSNDTIYTMNASIDSDTLTIDEFTRALDDDDEILDRFRTQILKALQTESVYGSPAEVGRIRMEVPTFTGWDTQTRIYSFFGPLISTQNDTFVKDQRTREPMPANPLAIEQVQRRYWPAYDVQSDLAGGTKRRGFTIHYTRFIALITFIAMVSWTISLLPKVRNHRWGARALISASLLLLVALIAWQTPHRLDGMNGAWMAPIESSGWFDTDELATVLEDQDLLRSYFRDRFDKMSLVHDPAHLGYYMQQGYRFGVAIGHEYRSLSPRPERPRVIENTHAELAYRKPLVRFKSIYAHLRVWYNQELDPDNQDLYRRGSFIENLKDHGMLRIEQFSGNEMRQHTIDMTTLLITLSVPFWAWVVVHLIGDARIWMTQRKRVNRGQCIYCGYRAADEALAARWEDAPEDGRSHNRVTDNPD